VEVAASDGCSLDANVHKTAMLEETADAMGTVLDFCALDIAMESATGGRCRRQSGRRAQRARTRLETSTLRTAIGGRGGRGGAGQGAPRRRWGGGGG
jgi:hypothetical protein